LHDRYLKPDIAEKALAGSSVQRSASAPSDV